VHDHSAFCVWVHEVSWPPLDGFSHRISIGYIDEKNLQPVK